MAQFDLHLYQNVHASGIEFTERMVNIAKGSLLSADASKVPTVLPVGTNGYQLVADSAAATGLKWQAIAAGHTQNTDTGTTSEEFHLDSDGHNIMLKACDAKLEIFDSDGIELADLAVKKLDAYEGQFTILQVSSTPTSSNDATNKTYVDSLLTANSAMVYKGTIGTGGTHEIAAFNSLATYNVGWTYRVITAGTIKGKICEIGDFIIAVAARAGTGQVDGDWNVWQANADGIVTGPASATADGIVLFNSTTGKLIKDSAKTIVTTLGTTDSTVPTSKAVKDVTDLAMLKSILTTQGNIIYASGASTPAVLAPGTAGQVLQTGGAGANPSWFTIGTMATETATKYIEKSLYDAHTILYATTDNTPAALDIANNTLVGREASGNIAALNDARVMNILFQTAPATKTSSGRVGQIAKDDNYFYVCTADNVWKRSILATNW